MPSQLYNLNRNPENVIGMELTTSEDMQFIQKWCEGKGYQCYVNLGLNDEWTMLIQTPAGQSIPGKIGDWAILKNDVSLSIVPANQGTALYTVVGPVA